MEEATKTKTFIVPLSVITPIDIARLLRELDALDEYLRQISIRQGSPVAELPGYSRMLDAVVHDNGFNLLEATERQELRSQLIQIQNTAPVLHISFSAEPPGAYVQKLVAWLRQNLHPSILVRVGLQPNIGAGCIVRTPNRQFDLSLRSFFESKHDFFMRKLHEVLADDDGSEAATPTEATQTVAVDAVRSEPVEEPASIPIEVSEVKS